MPEKFRLHEIVDYEQRCNVETGVFNGHLRTQDNYPNHDVMVEVFDRNDKLLRFTKSDYSGFYGFPADDASYMILSKRGAELKLDLDCKIK